MAHRKVTKSEKDTSSGPITAICNPSEEWYRRTSDQAIDDIESNLHSYYVTANGKTVNVIVSNGAHGKFLTTEPDDTKENNLLELPDC